MEEPENKIWTTQLLDFHVWVSGLKRLQASISLTPMYFPNHLSLDGLDILNSSLLKERTKPLIMLRKKLLRSDSLLPNFGLSYYEAEEFHQQKCAVKHWFCSLLKGSAVSSDFHKTRTK